MENRIVKFRLRIGNKIVGYEKWYSGHLVEGDPCSAQPCWLYSKDNKFWNPTYIYHRDKDKFTGLLDKNGKEIYEGDILEGGETIDNEPRRGVIKWVTTNYTACFDFGFLPSHIYCEVIGNLYENPELLVEKGE